MTDKATLAISENKYKSLTGSEKVDDKEKVRLAKMIASPVLDSGLTAHDFLNRETADRGEFICEINKQAQKIAETNEMDFGIKMLVSQAKALDTLFNALARRAGNNMGHYIDTVDTYMKLALKAQAQSRCTWETISKIKNPPNATFVKQANIAHGNQQINNGPSPTVNNHASREEKNQNRPNELLEADHHERLDSRTKAATSGIDQNMETVGAINRATD